MSIQKSHTKNKDQYLDKNGIYEVSAAELRNLIDNGITTGIQEFPAVPEPEAPVGDKMLVYVTSEGISPNKIVRYCVKDSSGRVTVLSSVII